MPPKRTCFTFSAVMGKRPRADSFSEEKRDEIVVDDATDNEDSSSVPRAPTALLSPTRQSRPPRTVLTWNAARRASTGQSPAEPSSSLTNAPATTPPRLVSTMTATTTTGTAGDTSAVLHIAPDDAAVITQSSEQPIPTFQTAASMMIGRPSTIAVPTGQGAPTPPVPQEETVATPSLAVQTTAPAPQPAPRAPKLAPMFANMPRFRTVFSDQSTETSATVPSSPQRSSGSRTLDAPSVKRADEDDFPRARPKKSAEELHLNAEQYDAYCKVVHEHRSVFITGGAGTGKTHLLKAIIGSLTPQTTFVTASTGIAALNIGGTTVHSFAGCGLVKPDRTFKDILAGVKRSKTSVMTWRRCTVLIIDEISMVDAYLLDALDYVGRRVRNNHVEPFGGIQIVFSGDFLQLPPVIKRDEYRDGAPLFCFECETWMKIDPVICALSVPYRQNNRRFYELLSDMRMGQITTRNAQYLLSLNTPLTLRHTEQHPITVRRVAPPPPPPPSASADGSTSKFSGPGRLLRGEIAGAAPLSALHHDATMEVARKWGITSTTPPPETTPPTTDATNDDGSPPTAAVANGKETSANEAEAEAEAEEPEAEKVVAYTTFDGYSILRSRVAQVEAENVHYYNELSTPQYFYKLYTDIGSADKGKSLPTEIHLRLYCRVMLTRNFGSADTDLANGSVGTVVDFVEIRTAYALKNTNLKFTDLRRVCVGVPDNLDRVHMMLPVVQFEIRRPNGTKTIREVLVEPQEWTQQRGTEVTRREVQIPLILAYALTIHKSQGMSLPNADIDFGSIFEAGQAYVALSRCTSLDGTRIHNFHPGVVTTNNVALSYYKAVELRQQREAWLAANQVTQIGIAPKPRERSFSNATTQLEDLRAHLCLLLDLSQDVKVTVVKRAISALDAPTSRLVMDVTAFYDLATSDAYAQLLQCMERHMIRVPSVVRETIDGASQLLASQGDGEPVDDEAGCDAAGERFPAAALSDAETSRRIYDLLRMSESLFGCEYQKPDEAMPLPPPSPEWKHFAPILPLLEVANDGEGGPSSSQQHSIIKEVDFLLNRDPREAAQHRPILEYALYLHHSTPPGVKSDVAVCTDSSSLAASALAFGLQVVFIDSRLYKADS